jgi:hypothetical protein
MSDDRLHLDSDALDGFTSQLNGLMSDTSAALYPDWMSGSAGDPEIESFLVWLAALDLQVGQRLRAYLTALADLTSASANAAADLDRRLLRMMP